MQWYTDYLDALRDGITASLGDQFDTRVNQFLSRKSSELLEFNAVGGDISALENERGSF
ncbi:hypothetical protein V2J59_09410 [Pseudomonas alliivorans]|uniref:hypothetical protein n=1 Tax=Pseudomonas alliivorans TaxID=2810613 RepID=UPI001F454FE4|nr:hypothetical protein [Pseudomonas alliivorans]MEE4325911.1 hypothetical protein [Pseudomonas alliivorans]MEE4336773.1 hypothetical protein [Pseudomonas alliivorans]MEE4367441.1 hypothetical protein [Pseudomonas alliivorans]MEE4622982.1 hypothetical protein [Pseudomonas alliivorans]MEE4649892.1 hypothetical protein [Pseudomonas alliivorans]